MKLNLGCGPLDIEDEIGIDCEPTLAAKVIANIMELPFPENSIEFVRCDHVLEHLPSRKVPLVLLEAMRVLKDRGKIRVGVPDFKAMCQEYLDNHVLGDRTLLLRQFYGSQVHDGEFHKSGWDKDTLFDLLKSCGFREIEINDDAGRFGTCIVAYGVK